MLSNFDVWKLLAGLGIGGVAVALAAKDTVENLFGSLTVMFDKPFDIGDWIIRGVEGAGTSAFFYDTTTTAMYTLSLLDALPIFVALWDRFPPAG